MSYLDLLNNDLIGEICNYLSIQDTLKLIMIIYDFNNNCIIKNTTNHIENKSYICETCGKDHMLIDMAKNVHKIYTNICKYCYDKYKKCASCGIMLRRRYSLNPGYYRGKFINNVSSVGFWSIHICENCQQH